MGWVFEDPHISSSNKQDGTVPLASLSPPSSHQNSCHKEALGELSGGHLVVLKGGGGGSALVWGVRGGGCCAMRVGEGSEVSGKWQPSPGVSGGKLLLNGEMKMGK